VAGDAPLALIVRLAGRAYGLPARSVERIVPMAEPTPVPAAPASVCGLLNLHGALLPVVDPRPMLGLSTPPFHPEQHLVALSARQRFLLWVDRAELLVTTARQASEGVLSLGDEVIPMLVPDQLDPGPIAGLEQRPS
jgi:chemotaxis signal transduction protein